MIALMTEETEEAEPEEQKDGQEPTEEEAKRQFELLKERMTRTS
jgi:hypothetical protein